MSGSAQPGGLSSSPMQSLRSRRPSETRPRQQKLAKSANKNANARKSTVVDDKLKKRMSIRYADISSPTDASIPALPTIPVGLRPGSSGEQDEIVLSGSQPRADARIDDQKLLGDENFDPDAYLKVKLANSTEAELKSLQSHLTSMKDDTAVELQRSVFKNYAEFVLISKEIGILENEMLELKESLSEWKGMPSILHIDESASVAERKRNVRSSIADLRVLYANQMQSLHSQIEGSAKFAPTTPGRHVVFEVDGILALNSATFKVSHIVKFVILDDAVLVAKKRRRNTGEPGRLVAERCWPLNEMLVLDTKDSANMTNVFKIRHNKETYVYKTETSSEKKSLLSQFRQVAEELATKKRKEREGEHERRKSMWAGTGDRTSMLYNPDSAPPMPDWMGELRDKVSSDPGSSKEKEERDARWVGDFADELTVAIALRQWDQAVSLVEQGKMQLAKTPSLGSKLNPLMASLTAALLDALASSSNRKSTVVSLASYMLRLNAGAAARNAFLNSRSEALRKYIRAIRFEGHIGMYINDLAIVVFTAIKHTADWYLASFRENEMASGFIEWAKQQITMYAEMFRKQVYVSDVDLQTVEEAVKITYSQSGKLLAEYGLDFHFLLDELLQKSETVPRQLPSTALPRMPASSPTDMSTPAPQHPISRSGTPFSSRPNYPTIPTRPSSPIANTSSRSSTPIARSPSSSRPSVQNVSIDHDYRSARFGQYNPAPPPRSSHRPGSSAGPLSQRNGMI